LIHTPSPQRHGFAPQQTLKQAELAVQTGMFPLFCYDPRKEGVFGQRLVLHNPQILFTKAKNPVHWAINEHRFQAHFKPLTSIQSVASIELTAWLQLAITEQPKKIPYVQIADDKIAVSLAFAQMVAQQYNAWQTLQELAGIVTPFTDAVEHSVAQHLRTEHQAELELLRTEYEAKIAQLNESYQQQAHNKIRDQLLGLAGY
jgi:pyruvate-ferredoxin/flavodoxin oxidoreductase